VQTRNDKEKAITMNELGEIRPSQLIFSFGVGALLDLPNMSALVMGLDDWDTTYCREITEERLLAALQRRVGGQLARLYLPPISSEDMLPNPAAPAVGVPVTPFPRWLRCPMCHTLATVDSGVFQLQQDRYRPERTKFVHTGCTKADNPPALTVRFLLACREGHLTDFPWIEYVHAGVVSCKPARLTMEERGVSGDASDILIKCLECGKFKNMSEAFDPDIFGRFHCPGHHPHLRMIDQQGCQEDARPILLGASNAWFPLVMSALSIPRTTDRLTRLVEERWADLRDIPSLDVTRYATAPSRMPVFVEFTAENIWEAIQAKRQRDSQPTGAEAQDLKTPEWEVLSQADPAAQTSDLKLRRVDPPLGFERYFESTVVVERIREVRALMGFTRIESNGDFAEAEMSDERRRTPLSRQSPKWLPASEVSGEGLFIRLKEDVLTAWEGKTAVRDLEREFFESHRRWRQMRRIEPDHEGFPGIRYILLHSLAHALMRQIAMDCGYTAASIRERLYCKRPNDANGPMAGMLLYTAAADSEGTLGGLITLGETVSLGRHLRQALETLRLCASDPLCAEQRPSADGRGIHAACCHACLFAPETSCERGNRYLDRGTLVAIFAERGTEFFDL
jgi:hypothetical protein